MDLAGVTRIANITGLDDIGIPVTLVTRPNARSLSVTQGKGATLSAAKLSSLMEAFEHFHAERCDCPLRLSSYRALERSHSVADVMRLPRTSRPFDPHARMLWSEARDLADGRSVYVPYELVHLDFSVPAPPGHGYFLFGSNGLGAGRHLDDALTHGLLELVERDALALFYERGPAAQSERRVRLASVDDATCRSLIQRFERAGVGVAVWDMTTDIGLAAFLCSVGERQTDPFRIIGTARGYGCHPDRAVALRRALTEAAQSRLTRIAGSRDDMQPAELSRLRQPFAMDHQRAHVEQEPHARHDFGAVPSHTPASPAETLTYARERLSASGLEQVLYVDLSCSDCPVVVVRVLAPGLEGFPDAPDYTRGARALRIAAVT